MYHIFHDTYHNLYYYADEEGFSTYAGSLQKLLSTPKSFTYRKQSDFTSLQRIFKLVGTDYWEDDICIANVETLDNLHIEYPELFI